MPHGLGTNVDRNITLIASCDHISHESLYLRRRHPQGLDPSYLAAVDSVVALGTVHSDDRVLGMVFAVPIAQIKQISIVKSIADRPLVIGHSLYQILFSIQLLEGEYAVGMYHLLHLCGLNLHRSKEINSFSGDNRERKPASYLRENLNLKP